jgi:hypothetical protein
VQEIPRTPDDAADEEAGQYLPIRLIRGIKVDYSAYSGNAIMAYFMILS